MSNRYHQWLVELTGLPTASGREDAVIAWVERYAARRKDVMLSRDRHGNLTLSRDKDRSARPLYLEAHMDHPSFVVRRVLSPREVEAEFRGGVERKYFPGSRVVRGSDRGEVIAALSEKQPLWRVRFEHDINIAAGDILMWDVGPSRIEGDRLHAPACDDLAGVASALAAFDQFREQPQVRVLLTRAEEMAFIGTIAACKSRIVPKAARMLCIESSRSYAESPIGGGPIVRVGDRTSTFDPDLTYRIGRIAEKLASEDKTFRWQRKLMPGGTCEASAFQCYGYIATCVCVPLGNYHNMNDVVGRIEAESISVSDFDQLVRLLVAVGKQLDDADQTPPLKARLEELYKQGKYVLKS